jgi:hypothetical protein
MAFVPLNTNNSDLANYNNVNNALRDLNNKKIKNADLSTTPGEPGGEWKSYTPTLTNISGGTINVAKYTQIGKTVFVKFLYTLAGAGVTGNPTITLPVTGTTDYTSDVGHIGLGAFLDAATQVYPGFISLSSTTASIRPLNTAGTNGGYGAATSATNPFTFGNGDKVSMSFAYEAA